LDICKVYVYPIETPIFDFHFSGEIIYVSDFNLHNVYAINLGMTRKRRLCPDKRLVRPQGLAVDGSGNILICDSRSHGIRIVHPSGSLSETVDSTGPDRFELPVDLTVCRGGYVCVVDMGGQRLRIF
jgi:hypothetical protein